MSLINDKLVHLTFVLPKWEALLLLLLISLNSLFYYPIREEIVLNTGSISLTEYPVYYV